MPILIPENPSFVNEAEKTVWKQLKKTLPDDVHLLYGVRVTQANVDKESDLIVIWPNLGLAFIEIKGGYITPNADGTFTQGSGRKKEVIDPVNQAHGAMYAIRDWINRHTSMNFSAPQTFMVAFPNALLQVDYSSPKVTRSQFIDKDDLSNAAEIVRRAIENRTGYAISPDAEDCRRVAHALSATTIDVTHVDELALIIDQRTEQIEQYIVENERLLDFVCDIRRFHVRGAAGTGKTSLALTHSRRLKQQGLRVAFICYSRALAASVRHGTESLPRSERIDVVQTFHNLGKEWGIDFPDKTTEEFWRYDAPKQFLQLAQKAQIVDKFDAIVIDESQDFAPEWWQVIEALLRDPVNGGIYAFGDASQEIFGRSAGYELPYTPLRLIVNLRNADPIAWNWRTTNFLR